MISRQWRGWQDERGQSLIEIAFTIPILLLLLVGLVDIGRLFVYKIGTANAAREAALLGARDPQSGTGGQDGICQRARTELGAPSVPNPCTTAPITVSCQRGGVSCGAVPSVPALYQTNGQGGADVTVTVTYQVPLLTVYLVGRGFVANPVNVRATATFGGLGQ